MCLLVFCICVFIYFIQMLFVIAKIATRERIVFICRCAIHSFSCSNFTQRLSTYYHLKVKNHERWTWTNFRYSKSTTVPIWHEFKVFKVVKHFLKNMFDGYRWFKIFKKTWIHSRMWKGSFSTNLRHLCHQCLMALED